MLWLHEFQFTRDARLMANERHPMSSEVSIHARRATRDTPLSGMWFGIMVSIHARRATRDICSREEFELRYVFQSTRDARHAIQT